jgi:hypothetical protein
MLLQEIGQQKSLGYSLFSLFLQPPPQVRVLEELYDPQPAGLMPPENIWPYPRRQPWPLETNFRNLYSRV